MHPKTYLAAALALAPSLITAERCANVAPPAELVDHLSRVASDDDSYSRASASEHGINRCQRTIHVPTYFHALLPSNATDEYMSQATLQKQLTVLNQAYAKHDIVFDLQGIDRTKNDDIAQLTFTQDTVTGAISGSENEALVEFWKEKRTGGYNTLHVYFYTAMGPTGDLLGIATFPTPSLGKEQAYLDGVHVAGDSLPGGALTAFNLGYTAVHEVGHWFGLFHVFGSSGECDEETGDFVSDTPLQSLKTSGCPVGKDSCRNAPGLDSIHNFMDYSDDPCLEEFTEGQEMRMHNLWNSIRIASW